MSTASTLTALSAKITARPNIPAAQLSPEEKLSAADMVGVGEALARATPWAVYLGDPKYNFKTTNAASVNTTAFQQAVTDARAGQGRLHLPPGSYPLNPVSIPLGKALIVAGQGGEDVYLQQYGTLLTTASATADLFTVGAAGCSLLHFGVKNTNASVTAGSGVLQNILGTHPTNNAAFPNGVGSNCRIEDVTFNGFFVNLHIKNGFNSSVRGCQFANSRRAGLLNASEQLPDAGDTHVSHCQFFGSKYAGEGAAVLLTSGGGLSLSQVKINSYFQDGIAVEPDFSQTPQGIEASTTMLLIGAGVSIENFTRNAIRARDIDGLTINGVVGGAYTNVNEYYHFTNCDRGKLIGNNPFNNVGFVADRVARFLDCKNWDVAMNSEGDFGGVDGAYLLSGTSVRGNNRDGIRIYAYGSGAYEPPTDPTAPGIVAPATVQETDTRLMYQGTFATNTESAWANAQAGPVAGQAVCSGITASNIGITTETGTFTGTGINYYASKSPNGSSLRFIIDSVQVGPSATLNSGAGTQYGASELIASPRVAYGVHTLRIVQDLTDPTLPLYIRQPGGAENPSAPAQGEMYMDRLEFV